MALRLRFVLAPAAILVLAAAGAVAAYVLWDPYPREPSSAFNRGRNAVWLRHSWLAESHSDAEVAALLGNLSDLGVSTVFPHLAPFSPDGTLPAYSADEADRFVRTARASTSPLRVLPWVGGVLRGHRGTGPGTVDLRDAEARRGIARELRRLVARHGFDGVHLDVEPIPSGSPEFLTLLHEVRAELPPEAALSVAAMRPSTFGRLNVSPHHAWDPSYYAAVAPFVDEMAVMTYDTGIPLRKWYVRHLADATRSIAASIHGSNPSCRLLMGVPTHTRRRKTQVENLLSALRGVRRGLEELDPGTREVFDGVALYAEWTTDAEEWSAFRTEWLREPEER